MVGSIAMTKLWIAAQAVLMVAASAWSVAAFSPVMFQRSDIAIVTAARAAFHPSTTSNTRTTRRHTPVLFHSQSNENEEENDASSDLLQQANRLREQAKELEEQLRDADVSSSSNDSTAAPGMMTPKPITKLADSVWAFRYRFSSQPSNDKDDVDETPQVFYSGSVSIRLRGDGYSEMTQYDSKALQITKVWGWDEEYSTKDEQTYLLLSMDAQFPDTDPMLPRQSERYYFQARLEREDGTALDKTSDAALVLRDGTVTCKKDVTEKTGGMWGIFQVAGILTEFRYVGEFVAKPAQ